MLLYVTLLLAERDAILLRRWLLRWWRHAPPSYAPPSCGPRGAAASFPYGSGLGDERGGAIACARAVQRNGTAVLFLWLRRALLSPRVHPRASPPARRACCALLRASGTKASHREKIAIVRVRVRYTPPHHRGVTDPCTDTNINTFESCA